MKAWYARFVLWLIEPALQLRHRRFDAQVRTLLDSIRTETLH